MGGRIAVGKRGRWFLRYCPKEGEKSGVRKETRDHMKGKKVRMKEKVRREWGEIKEKMVEGREGVKKWSRIESGNE